ncbi:glyoxalase [Croceicoccus estronivorus]|uniref:VOC family protein n=1 Tax=Croceicoccus estronivorus TaxID=1172626 RepID=UPI0008336242|nr:VOC family protein [Croceicoccus estronivorus]OCC22626.1 glyoxalase [Croceicoccus estronivorus]
MTVKALGYVIVTTEKMAEWDSYLADVVGVMRGEGAPEGTAFYRIDDRPFRFWVRPGNEERLAAAGYEVEDAAALDALKAAISAAGRPVEDGTAEEAKARGVAAFFRTSDPDGNGLEFFHGDTRDNVAFVSPAGVSGFVTGDMGMGHAVFAAPSFEATHAFYRDVVGFHDTDIPRFQLTGAEDDPGMGFAFMHAENGRHHSIAIGEMPIPPSGCVHLMLEMKTISDVGKCHDRMRAAKVPESASIGRHVNDQTFGFYMQTPSGFDLEIGCDPLVIDPESWEPTAHLVPSEWGHVWAWQKAMED